MKIEKEEIGSSVLLLLAVGCIWAAAWRIVLNGEEFSSTGRTSPMFGILLGLTLVGLAIYQYRVGSSGDPARNGRFERPFVFWSGLFAFAICGIGFVSLGLYAIVR